MLSPKNWVEVKGYAFPPFALIGRCLRKLQDQEDSHLVLVAPVWKSQPWYPLLLHLCVASPILLPQYSGLLSRQGEIHPLTNLQLAGWPILLRSWHFPKGSNTTRGSLEKRNHLCLLPSLG